MARLENDVKNLAAEFHEHAEQAVHPGFTNELRDIKDALKDLTNRWLVVGGAIVTLLITILLSLLGVLWSLIHAAPVVPK